MKSRDVYAGLHCVSDGQFAALFEWIGRPEFARDPRFNTALARYTNNDALYASISEFFARHDSGFLFTEGQRRGIPVALIPTVNEVLEWEQLKARRFFETIDDPVLGTIRVPGPPLRLSGQPMRPS